MKRIFGLVVAMALATGAGVLWATPPDQGEGSTVWDCGLPDNFFPRHDCGDFLICETAAIDWTWKLFYNKDGEAIRYWEKQKIIGGVYEWGNPDNFVPYIPLSLTYKLDLVDGEEVITGVWAQITIPGHGNILRDVGRIVWDADGNRIFEAGDHDWWDGEWEAVCDYMDND